MKKYDLILKLSFIPFILVLYIDEYITAHPLADVIFIIFIAGVLYQLCYNIFLHKKDGVSIKKSIANTFLYLFMSIIIQIIVFYIVIYFKGYEFTAFTQTFGPYYGINAWKNTGFVPLLAVPAMIISLIYCTVYILVSVHQKKKKSRM